MAAMRKWRVAVRYEQPEANWIAGRMDHEQAVKMFSKLMQQQDVVSVHLERIEPTPVIQRPSNF